MNARKIAVIGECMVEMKRKEQAFSYSFGGDTLNTAVYLARLLPFQDFSIHYVTALGTDTLSDEMLAKWEDESIVTKGVQRLADKLPGLYLIETDAKGERSFRYWRSDSAAKYMLDGAGGQRIEAYMADADCIYLSGITLAILSPEARQYVFKILGQAKARGAKVVFDNNYRPRLWPDSNIARAAYDQAYSLSSIALVTVEDDITLYGDDDTSQILCRLQSIGVQELAIKRGNQSCLVYSNGSSDEVPAIEVKTVVDTTAAGDSFGAAYLSARLLGKSTVDSAVVGHRVASTVIQYSGAIIPREAINAPALLELR